ncbi:MAG TPA: PQQ-dependent sugar dehydrogenase [Phnomibacter sp.]|nr:PQQ-dependent sugar dehydrogenase [Phnomibacter sp.]
MFSPLRKAKKGLLLASFSILCTTLGYSQTLTSSRLREVFKEEQIADIDSNTNSNLNNTDNGAWEIYYEPNEDSLWISENKNYRIRKVATKAPYGFRFVLNISKTGTVFSPNVRCEFAPGDNTWPQGGMMGMVLHPQFKAASSPQNFVYVAYVKKFIGGGPDGELATRYRTATNPFSGEVVKGDLFTTYIVQFEYLNGQLVNPEIICDSIPGSNDHNSGRLTIAPVGGVDYLFYSCGDMGGGQFYSAERTNKAAWTNSYEGKILRFNLQKDGDADQGTVDYNRWIPNDNPYNNIAPVTGQSAVHSIGHRNVQGFAYTGGKFYAASHGPFTDDEVNILSPGMDYGHPRVIGKKADNNYLNAKAATQYFQGWGNKYNNATSGQSNSRMICSLPLIDETQTIPNYVDPIFSFYDATRGATASVIQNIYTANNPGNDTWPSVAPSGMDVYDKGKIPGWNNSLLLASLKRGSVFRLKLSSDGNAIQSINDGSNTYDTAVLFNTKNRFRDLAIDKNGLSFYASIDGSGSTSGPTTTTPASSVCEGCILKYTFLGYAHSSGISTIPTSIPIAEGTNDNCEALQPIVINADNTNYWVPITDVNGKIIAEIKANGNAIGTVSGSLFRNGATDGIRTTPGTNKPYVDRNLTLNVTGTPPFNNNGGVDVRLYFTNAEFTKLTAEDATITATNLGLFKNSTSTCQTIVSGATNLISGTIVSNTFGSQGYYVQGTVNSFSTFFVASKTISVLPVTLKEIKANWLGNLAAISWTTATEQNTASFDVERSLDGRNFTVVGNVKAKGNSNIPVDYKFTDVSVANLSAPIFYYRLIMKDVDGKASFSKTVTLTRGGSAFFVRAFPNPVKTTTTLQIFSDKDEKLSWQLTDLSGRTIRSQTQQVVKGQNNISIDMNNLPAGFYQLVVKGQQFTQVMKLQKQ